MWRLSKYDLIHGTCVSEFTAINVFEFTPPFVDNYILLPIDGADTYIKIIFIHEFQNFKRRNSENRDKSFISCNLYQGNQKLVSFNETKIIIKKTPIRHIALRWPLLT